MLFYWDYITRPREPQGSGNDTHGDAENNWVCGRGEVVDHD